MKNLSVFVVVAAFAVAWTAGALKAEEIPTAAESRRISVSICPSGNPELQHEISVIMRMVNEEVYLASHGGTRSAEFSIPHYQSAAMNTVLGKLAKLGYRVQISKPSPSDVKIFGDLLTMHISW